MSEANEKPANALITGMSTQQSLAGVLTGAGVINNIQLTADSLPSVVISKVESQLAIRHRANAEAREAANKRRQELVDAFEKRFRAWALDVETECNDRLPSVLPDVDGSERVNVNTSHQLTDDGNMLLVRIKRTQTATRKAQERLAESKTQRYDNLCLEIWEYMPLPEWVQEHRDAVKQIDDELISLNKQLVTIKQCEARLPSMARLAQGNTVAHVLSGTQEGTSLLEKLESSANRVLEEAGLL